MKLTFLSSNKYKVEEAVTILQTKNIQVVGTSVKIPEIQTENVRDLVRDKALKAFSRIGRPVFVEHTGLYIEALNQLPGGLTQIFWDRLKAEGFIQLISHAKHSPVIARTMIGYCDNQKMHFFEGEVRGTFAEQSRGPDHFQWDCIFIPDGFNQTFAEMGEKKNEISMRRQALDQFSQFLREKNG